VRGARRATCATLFASTPYTRRCVTPTLCHSQTSSRCVLGVCAWRACACACACACGARTARRCLAVVFRRTFRTPTNSVWPCVCVCPPQVDNATFATVLELCEVGDLEGHLAQYHVRQLLVRHLRAARATPGTTRAGVCAPMSCARAQGAPHCHAVARRPPCSAAPTTTTTHTRADAARARGARDHRTGLCWPRLPQPRPRQQQWRLQWRRQRQQWPACDTL
jgi:hypothetical protein